MDNLVLVVLKSKLIKLKKTFLFVNINTYFVVVVVVVVVVVLAGGISKTFVW